jgi:putative sigma-54 modulation protein
VRTLVKGKNIDVPEAVRKYAERKMRRLERFLDERSEAVVELSTERRRSAADSQIVSVSLVMDGRTLHGHAAGPTHQAGLDTVIDRIERQAIDMRQKPRSKVRPDAIRALRRVASRIAPSVSPSDRPSVETAETAPRPSGKRSAPRNSGTSGRAEPERPASARSRIVKTKRFAIEPMFEEDALARMEELGHLFFIFVNAENERVCVLYRRKAGDFGLIEPMIGGEYTAGRSGPGSRGGRGSPGRDGAGRG